MENIDVKVYSALPQEAMYIRKTVFVDEQGFFDDVEDIDSSATHLVAFDGESAVATCRTYRQADGSFILGRMAVVKERRGTGLGAHLIGEAEKEIKKMGGETVLIHAQLHAKGFYEFCGYTAFGEVENEQGQPHIWLKKKSEF